jgi:hypothetical protein
MCLTPYHNASEHRSFSTCDWTGLSQNTSFFSPPIHLVLVRLYQDYTQKVPVGLHDNLKKKMWSAYFSHVIATMT